VYHFIKRACKEHNKPEVDVTDEAMEMLQNYSWPGNVRELENVITRAVVLQRNNIIDTSVLWLSEVESPEPDVSDLQQRGLKAAAKEAEKALLLQALEANQWNKTRTAKQLGISYRSLMYKIKEYGLRELQQHRSDGKVLPFSSGKARS
jgi:DNA-binding NtrC family response regulator